MNNVSSIWKAWMKFCGKSPLYYAIPLFILLFFIERNKKERKYLSIVLILFIVMLYNPISYRILTSVVGSSNYRIFWILPGWFAFTYIFVRIVEIIPRRGIQLSFVIIACFISFWGLAKYREYSTEVSNLFQIPQDTMVLADEMIQMMDDSGMETAVLYGNYDFLATLRQYNHRFILHASPRNHFIMEEHANEISYLGLGHQITTGEITMDKDYASDILIENDVSFVVLHRDLTDSIDFLSTIGWKEVAGTEQYAVLSQNEFNEIDE